jgi:hypothetical protein
MNIVANRKAVSRMARCHHVAGGRAAISMTAWGSRRMMIGVEERKENEI